jgi:hypothetical protein
MRLSLIITMTLVFAFALLPQEASADCYSECQNIGNGVFWGCFNQCDGDCWEQQDDCLYGCQGNWFCEIGCYNAYDACNQGCVQSCSEESCIAFEECMIECEP